MTTGLSVTILGCGSSGGVPRIGGLWGQCDPNNPRNHRRRCSLLIQRVSAEGTTNVLVDTSPDLRCQLLDAGIGTLDAVVFTHEHADHTNGIDDLRMVAMNCRNRIPVHARSGTAAAIKGRFGYAFETPLGSNYPPFLDLILIDGNLAIDGPGGTVELTPFVVEHGDITSLGFRINTLAYLPDALDIPESSWPILADLDCWIVDALRRKPHPSHAHLAKTLTWIERAKPKQAILTNLHIDLDYRALCDETPPNVVAAHDGLSIRISG
ncbi:MAG: MBL fold metallo-hydrolase [Paracoccaceae bacterium]|nr:MBL fold metallo-hydrolase [Paracoccaceae bacterium]MDE2912470.1 MBL fold metallo-hydrolase [Paracoccaceae bacterium]